jgi:hypothetical protein
MYIYIYIYIYIYDIYIYIYIYIYVYSQYIHMERNIIALSIFMVGPVSSLCLSGGGGAPGA